MNKIVEQQLSILDLPHVLPPPSRESDSFKSPPEHSYRSGGPETSEKAVRSLNTAHLEQLVFETIKSFGEEGCIFEFTGKNFSIGRANRSRQSKDGASYAARSKTSAKSSCLISFHPQPE